MDRGRRRQFFCFLFYFILSLLLFCFIFFMKGISALGASPCIQDFALMRLTFLDRLHTIAQLMSNSQTCKGVFQNKNPDLAKPKGNNPENGRFFPLRQKSHTRFGGGEWFFFFWLFPAGDYPRSVFGVRFFFFSRLGAGGGGGDIAIRNPFTGERSC